MSTVEDIARLLKEAAASMKSDVRGSIAKLEAAYAIAVALGNPDDTAVVAEDLARAWTRRKSFAKSLQYARKATKLAATSRTSWTTLAKMAELAGTRVGGPRKEGRARALFRAAASAYRKAASLTKDAEDKRWLMELAGDAAREGKSPAP